MFVALMPPKKNSVEATSMLTQGDGTIAS